MNLLEYEAKAVLRRFDIPIPSGKVFRIGDKLPITPVRAEIASLYRSVMMPVSGPRKQSTVSGMV
ncbi:MAG: hypothetical protein ABI303_01765 [Candidatus Saccharimonas sp.]